MRISLNRPTGLGCVACVLLWVSAAGAEPRPVGGVATLTPTFGQSTFAGRGTAFAMRYELELLGRFGRVSPSVRAGLAHFAASSVKFGDSDSEFTDPNCVDPIAQGCVAAARFERPARLIVGDTAVGLEVAAFSNDTIALVPRFDLVIPTSRYSRAHALLFGAHLGLDASIAVGDRVNISLFGRLRKDAHRSNAEFDGDEAKIQPGPFGFRTAGSHLRGREEDAASLTRTGGGLNGPGVVVVNPDTNVSGSTHLGFEVSVDLYAGFFADVGFGWTHLWWYPPPLDGNARQANYNTGTLGIGWTQDIGPVGLHTRLATATTGLTRTPDNQSSTFPWWYFHDPSANRSVVELSLGASY